MSRILNEDDFAVTLLAVGIIVAFFSPELTGILAPYALPALFFVIVFSMVPFATATRAELTQIDAAVWRMVAWQQVILPCLVIALGILLRFPDPVISLMIVTACAGSLFASPALASLLNLNTRRALQCMVLTTLVMPASLYVCLSAFHGVNVHLELNEYLYRTSIFLLIPFALFGCYRVFAARVSHNVHQNMSSFSRWAAIVALLIFGVGIMHEAAIQFTTDPLKIIFYLMIVSALTIGMLLVTIIVMYPYGSREAMTAGILNGFRNVGLGFALVGNMIGSELAPYVGVSMIPIFIAPVIIRLVFTAASDAGESKVAIGAYRPAT